jgi:hypothetical protein
MPRLEEMTLPELIADSMALVKRVAAGLAASAGYQPPEGTEEEAGT